MSLGLTECGYLGGDGKIYYNSATYALPTWVEMDEAIDVSIPDFTDTMAEVATRSGSFAYEKPAKTRLAVEMSYLYRGNQTVWDALKAIKLAKGPIHISVMDGDITVAGTEGLEMVANIAQFPIGQALEEMMTHDTIRFTPRYICDGSGKIDPTWVVISNPVHADAKSTAEEIEKAASRLNLCGSKMNPQIVAELIRRGRMKMQHRAVPMTVEDAIKDDARLKQYIAHYPPNMTVYKVPKEAANYPATPPAPQ